MAEKIGAVQTAAEFLKRRAGDARPEDLMPFLDNAADAPPAPEDEPPERGRSSKTRN